MLTNKELPELEIFYETYSAENVKPNKRCRGDNPVIGKIERMIGEACMFLDFYINFREASKGMGFFYKYRDAKMFSDGVLVQLRLKGKYSLDGILIEDLDVGKSYEHQGSFVGEVEVKLGYKEGVDEHDVKMVRDAIVGSGLERDRKA